MTEAQFITGESDPADFTVDQVAAHLADADPAEFDRVQALEADGKARKGITDLTLPAPEDVGTDAQPADPDALAVGDRYQGDDGYTREVVSV